MHARMHAPTHARTCTHTHTHTTHTHTVWHLTYLANSLIRGTYTHLQRNTTWHRHIAQIPHAQNIGGIFSTISTFEAASNPTMQCHISLSAQWLPGVSAISFLCVFNKPSHRDICVKLFLKSAPTSFNLKVSNKGPSSLNVHHCPWPLSPSFLFFILQVRIWLCNILFH